MSDERYPAIMISIRDTMRRITLKDWDIDLARLDFLSLLELHLFVLTVEARLKIERER